MNLLTDEDSEEYFENRPKDITKLFEDEDMFQPKKQPVRPVLKNRSNFLSQDELASKERELLELQRSFKQIVVIEKVKKLSNMGYSEHERLLRLNSKGVQYFSTIPKSLQGTIITSSDLISAKMQPKCSIHLWSIIECDDLNQTERTKYKKFFKEETLAFKIVFDKRGLVKGDFKFTDKDDYDEEDSQEETISPPDAPLKDLRGDKVWYFSCGVEGKQIGIHPDSWIKNVSIKAMMANPQLFKQSSTFKRILAEHASKTEKLAQEIKSLRQPAAQRKQSTTFAKSELLKPESKQDNSKKQVSIAESSQNTLKNPKASFVDEKPIGSIKNGKGEKKTVEEIDDIIKTQLNINKANPKDELKQDKGLNLSGRDYGNNALMSSNTTMTKERKEQVKQIIDTYNQRQTTMKRDLESFEHIGWDMKYQNQFEYLVQSIGDQKRHLKISERFIEHIGKFRQTATAIVKQIVDELHLTDKERTINPVAQQIAMSQFELFYDEENTKPMIFYDQQQTKNIIIKLTHQGDVYYDTTHLNLPFSKESIQLSFQELSQNSVQARDQLAKKERYWAKQFGREQLSNDVIFDAIYLNSKPDESFRLRVPLTALIDYKGFRAMAIAKIQISQMSQPDLGFSDGIYMAQDERLKDEMGFIGEVLNLRDNRVSIATNSFQKENIPVSSYIRVYKHQDLENRRGAGFDSPPARRWFDFHYGELEYNNHPKFILNTAEIFPLDLEIRDNIYPNRDKVLRPEFLCTYEFALKADTKRQLPQYAQSRIMQQNYQNKSKQNTLGDPNYSAFDQNDKREEIDQKDLVVLNEAARFLRENTIAQFVDYLDNLVIVPIDSESLTQAFHVAGINMRYLGLVANKTELPHIKDICITEMIGRTLKRLFNTQISSLILNHQDQLNAIRKQEEEVRNQLKELQGKRTTHIIINQNDISSTQNRRNLSINELEQRLEIIAKEKRDLNQDMDVNMQMWTLDFMNLVFGRGQEHEEFFNELIYLEAAIYYDIKLDLLKKHPLRLNALFFSLIELIKIKVSSSEIRISEQEKSRENRGINQKERKLTKGYASNEAETFFKNFGKDEKPFGSFEPKPRYHFELQPKSKTLSLRNLPYTMLASKFKEYKEKSYINDAIESCRMRSHIRLHLMNDEADTETQADLCQIYLDRSQWTLAQKFARKALKKTPALHAKSIKFYCILMQAFYMDEKISEADVCFTKALEILDHHWGPFHPLHINIYSIMAQLLIHNGKHDDAIYLFKASLLCCMRILGPNHVQTGDVHMDFGKLYLFKNKKQESLQHFLEAYLIFDSYFGQNALQTAEAAMNVAAILEEDGKLKEAFIYAKVAANTFANVFSIENPTAIQALWQQLSISYALREPDTVKQAAHLLNALTKRDLLNSDSPLPFEKKGKLHQKKPALNRSNSNNDGSKKQEPTAKDVEREQAINDQMDNIKIHAIATAIIEITRTLPPKTKKYIKRFCDKTLFKKKMEEAKERNEEVFPNLIDYHLKNIDPMKICQVKSLKFLPANVEQLLYWYQIQLQLNIDDFDVSAGGLKTAENAARFGNEKSSEIEVECPFIRFYKQKIEEVRTMEEQEENKVAKFVEMGAGVSGLLVLNENEDKNYNGQLNQDNNIFGREEMQKGIGIFGTYAEDKDDFDYDSFFLKLIQTFDNINFYNLLIL